MEELKPNSSNEEKKYVNGKNKGKKAKIAVIILAIICAVIIGFQIYAATNGYGNVFSMIKEWGTPKSASTANEVVREKANEVTSNTIASKEKTENKNNTQLNINSTTESKKGTQLEPDNYAEEVKKDEQKSNIQLEPGNYAEMVEIDDAYDKFLAKMPKTEEYRSTRIDIDNDGIHELIVVTGDSEATKIATYYTYSFSNGEVKELGNHGFGHSMLYKMNNKDYLLWVNGQMGAEEVYKVYIYKSGLAKEKVSERVLNEGETYTEGDVALKELSY